jgi:hypothetical protein
MSCYSIGNTTTVSSYCCSQIGLLALQCNLEAERKRLAEWHAAQDWTHAPRRVAVAGGRWGIGRAEALRQAKVQSKY